MIENLDDYADLAVEQGWRPPKRTRTGYQFYPPSGVIVTLLCGTNGRCADPAVRRNWRSELRRVGLLIPDDTHKPKGKRENCMSKASNNGAHSHAAAHMAPTPTPTPQSKPATASPPELSLADLFTRVTDALNGIVDDIGDVQTLLEQIRSKSDKSAKLRELLKAQRELMDELHDE